MILNKYLHYLQEKIPYNKDDLRPYHYGISAVIMEDNKILMMDHVKFNFWTIPVGKVNEGQSITDGLKSELKEELNIIPTKFKQIGKFKNEYLRQGKKVVVDARIFHVEEWRGTIKNNEPRKHRSIKYMTINEIKKLKKTSDATKEMLKIMG